MNANELYVVPAERHVERLAALGSPAETRSAFRARLAATLLPEIRFADPRETRLALTVALERGAGRQLDLFGQGVADPLLAALATRGGASWVHAIAAVDEAIGALRKRGVTDAQLDRVRGTGVAAARAKTLAAAMRALDSTLERAGARDGRLLGDALADAIRHAPATIATVVGAGRVRARWLLQWEAHDLAWWKALDETLSQRNGFARIILPTFDTRLEGARERDPLEVVAESIARQLDGPPESETIESVLGDLASKAPPATVASRVRVIRTTNVRVQARQCAQLVRDALATGACVERVAVAYPLRDDRTLVPLRRELEEAGVVFHDGMGTLPIQVPVVAAALHALVAAESLDRLAVARLLRSGYVDAPRFLGVADADVSFREAERTLARIARRFETRATSTGSDPAERLVRTAAKSARNDDSDDELAVRRLVETLVRVRSAKTRGERVRAARTFFHEVGFASRAGRGALATFACDEAPTGVDRAERIALARDVRAWEVLEGALDLYELAAKRAAAVDLPVAAEVFRLELEAILDQASPLPNAGRAGAVRVTRLADVVGDELDLLIVLDANDGRLPRDGRSATLVSEALEQSLARAVRGFVAEPASETAARDLAALAFAASESKRILFLTTTEDSAEAPSSPSRVVVALERAGVVLEEPSVEERVPAGVLDVARRVERERTREGYFLDPTRPVTDIVGSLAERPEIASVVLQATGGIPERSLAVTSLERFAKCAFMGYAHAVLGARQGEEQHELPDAREEGNLGHSALAAAFVATRDEWACRPRDQERIVTVGLAAAEVAIAAADAYAPLRTIVRLRVRESVRAVLTRALGDEEWDFSLAEQEFGSSRGWLAFSIADRLWLRGSIDRVDRAHAARSTDAAARVVDYKRSKSTVREAGAMLGVTAIQVPIYAAVTAEHLHVRATGIYLPIQPRDLATERVRRSADGGPEARVGDLAAREGGSSEIERRALALVDGARAGRFAPIPAKESECIYCSASGGCRKPRFAMAPLEGTDGEESS